MRQYFHSVKARYRWLEGNSNKQSALGLAIIASWGSLFPVSFPLLTLNAGTFCCTDHLICYSGCQILRM